MNVTTRMNKQMKDAATMVRSLHQENAELQQQLTKTMNELALLQLKYERVKVALINGWPMRLESDDIVIL